MTIELPEKKASEATFNTSFVKLFRPGVNQARVYGACMHVWVYVRMHLCMCVFMYCNVMQCNVIQCNVCMYVCMYVCM